MKAVLSQLQLQVSRLDERFLRSFLVLLALASALILNSPTDGPGGIR